MSFAILPMLSSLFGRAGYKGRRRNGPRTATRLCRTERLEPRSMMAANVTASLVNGTLLVEGTEYNDSIYVRQVNNNISIDGVRISGYGYVNKIEMRGLGGHDTLRLDGNGVYGQAVQIPSLVFGGDGNDYIVGGSARDELQGGRGNDSLYGLGGNDLLCGQDHNDLIYGGEGHDELQGGLGNDELLGENGADKLFGQNGDDWLWGGYGDDKVDGGAGYDVAFGGAGVDTFYNLNDQVYWFQHPHLKSPIRRVGDQANYGAQDLNA